MMAVICMVLVFVVLPAVMAAAGLWVKDWGKA